MAGYGYVYELNFDGWLDVSPLVNTKNTQVTFNAFGNDLKGSRDVSKITLMHGKDPRKSLEFHSDVYRRLLEAKNNRAVVRFRMLHGTEAVFTGNVDLGNLKQSTSSIPEEISLEIEDISYLLDKEIPSSVEYPDADLVDAIGNIIDAPIFSKSDPANSIVVKLLLLAGYSVSDIDFNHSNSVMDGDSLARVRFVYDVDDKKTFRDRINTMLMEHRCILTNNADGTFCIRRTFITAEQQAPAIPAYLLKDKITSAGGDYQKDGVAVKWSSLAFAKKQTVYQASVTPSFDSENEDKGEEVEAEGYWPETGDIEDVWYQYDAKFLDRPYYTKQTRLQNKDLSLISSRNVQYEIDCDDTITEVIESRVVLPKKAKFLFYNSAITIKRVRGFNVLADVLFRKKISTYTSPEASTSPEDYESEFIFNAEAADYLASHMFLMHNHGDMTYTWTQKADVNILDVFTVQIPGTAISTKAIVKNVTKTYPTAGLVLCKVTAIGIAPFDLLPSKKVAWINGSGKKGDKGETLIHQWAVGYNGDIPPTFVAVLSENGEPIGYTSPVGFMDQWYTTKPSVPADKYLWHRYRYPSDSEWIYIIETRPVSLNAPYSKIIYKSAAEKPATPSGDCSTIPSGWSTTPPERVEGQTIWACTGNVTWTSINEPVYSVWSTASAWSGDKGEQGLQGLQGPQGDQGIQGPTGEDGLTAYNHIAYADDAVGTGFSQSPTGKAYIGFYTDHTELDSTNPADYAWSLIKGADGTQGIPGPAGADGLTAYFHTAWANSADGTTDFSTTVHAGKLYIGTYSDNTQADSTNPSSYKWVKIKGETGDKGDTGDTGESAKGIQLYFSSETLPTTSRGVPKISTITCTALPQNLPVTQASDITWACSDAAVTLTPKIGDMYSVEIDTSEVSTLSFSITATIGAYPVTRWINVVADGLPAPMKLPMATTETPKETLDGEPLVAGDYFVVGAEFVEASVTYKVGTLWEYTGTSWVLSSDKMKALNAMGDFTTVASAAEDDVFCRLIAQEIYAQSAVIEEIGTKEITVKEDGSIGSEDFAEDEEGIPTSGYKLDNPLTPLGRRGRVRAHGGIFNNTTIYGSIIHDALVTRKSAPTTPVTFPSKTAWNRKDFWNALSVTENSADMIAADLNIAGTAYSYLRKITSASYIKTLLAYQSLALSDWSAVTTYTSMGTGFANISGKVRFVLLGGIPLESRVQIYKNGALILDYISQTSGATRTFSDSVAVNKGDTIGWRYRNAQTTCELGIDWRSPQNCIHVSNGTTSWDTIEGMASDYLARGRWQCSSPITFDSNNILNYALANAFIAGFASLPEGVEIQADNAVSKVTYGGLTDQPVNSVINYGSSIRLNYAGGYITFVAGSNADGSFVGWYNAVASISVLSKEGIVTSNIIPKDTTREIGEFDNPFLKGYIKQLIGETLSLSGAASIGGAISAANFESKSVSGVSLDTLVKSGFYRVGYATGLPPSAADWGTLFVAQGGDTITQIYGDYSTGFTYYRTGNPPAAGGSGSWRSWRSNNIMAGLTYAVGSSHQYLPAIGIGDSISFSCSQTYSNRYLYTPAGGSYVLWIKQAQTGSEETYYTYWWTIIAGSSPVPMQPYENYSYTMYLTRIS